MTPSANQLAGLIIIDGHNLIPKIPGLSLEDLDDEAALIRRLQSYAKNNRKQIRVFFDKAAPGHTGVQAHGMVTAEFVGGGIIADEAIRRFVTAMGNTAKQVTVVSSDRFVQKNAKERGARVVTSEAFATELMRLTAGDPRARPKPAAKPVPPAEEKPVKKKKPGEAGEGRGGTGNLDEWLEMFGLDEEQAKKPIDLGNNQKKKWKRGR